MLEKVREEALSPRVDSCGRPHHVRSLTPGSHLSWSGAAGLYCGTPAAAHCAVVSSPVQSALVGRLAIDGSNQPLAENWLGALISSAVPLRAGHSLSFIPGPIPALSCSS